MKPVPYRLIIQDAPDNQSPTEVYSHGFPFSVLSPSLPPNPFFLDYLSCSCFSAEEESIPHHVQEVLESDLSEQLSLRDTLSESYRRMYLNDPI